MADVIEDREAADLMYENAKGNHVLMFTPKQLDAILSIIAMGVAYHAETCEGENEDCRKATFAYEVGRFTDAMLETFNATGKKLVINFAKLQDFPEFDATQH